MRRPDFFAPKSRPATILLLAALAYFCATAARDLQPFDSAEFALNAVQLGVGHPPGQPFYLLLGALFVRIAPIGAPWALSLFSAFATVLAIFVALRIARMLRGGESNVLDAILVGTACLLPGVWDMATRPEVYSLAALLLCAGVGLILTGSNRRIPAAGLLFGLGASVNPAMAVAIALSVAPALLAWLLQKPDRRKVLAFAGAVGAGLIGLLPYGILPILGAHPHGAVVWGEPLHGDSLRHYLAGRDYRSWHLTLDEFAHNLAAALAWLLHTGQLPLILLGAIGFLRSPLPIFARIIPVLATLFSLALIALNHPFLPTNPDYDGYLLPAVWLSAAGLPLLGLGGDKRPRDPSTLQAVSAVGQGRLIGHYMDELASHGLIGGQVLVTPLDFIVRNQYVHARTTMHKLLELGVVPVVNENDAVADDEIRFGDNDRIAALVAHLVDAEHLVLLTDTPGVFTADPRAHADASLIEEIVEIERFEDDAHPQPVQIGCHRRFIDQLGGRGAEHQGDSRQLRIDLDQREQVPSLFPAARKEEVLDNEIGRERLDAGQIERFAAGADAVALVLQQFPQQVENLRGIVDDENMGLLVNGDHGGAFRLRAGLGPKGSGRGRRRSPKGGDNWRGSRKGAGSRTDSFVRCQQASTILGRPVVARRGVREGR